MNLYIFFFASKLRPVLIYIYDIYTYMYTYKLNDTIYDRAALYLAQVGQIF